MTLSQELVKRGIFVSHFRFDDAQMELRVLEEIQNLCTLIGAPVQSYKEIAFCRLRPDGTRLQRSYQSREAGSLVPRRQADNKGVVKAHF